MAISTPTAVIAANSQAASGGSVTTTVDAPAGSLLVLAVAIYSTAGAYSITSVTLSNGDTVTQAVQPAPTTLYNMSIWYVVLVHDLPVGSTITATTTAGVSSYTLGAWYVTGANGGLDATASYSPNGGAGTSVSLATGALAASSEIVFGAIRYTSGAYVEGSGFSTLYNASGQMTAAYQIVSSSGSVTWAPSWATSSFIGGVIASFKATGSAGAGHNNLLLMSVG